MIEVESCKSIGVCKTMGDFRFRFFKKDYFGSQNVYYCCCNVLYDWRFEYYLIIFVKRIYWMVALTLTLKNGLC